MGNLKRLVEAITRESSGVQAKLLIARVGLKAGVNLTRITDGTPDNIDIETKILKSASLVLGKEINFKREE